jgi:hypothetical protein
VLASGEPGVDLTTGAFKIGDGTTAWQSMATQYAPQSMVNNPRGVVAVGDGLNPAPTLNASSIDLTSGILYTFDPTRRYRANYTIRAQSSATTIQFQLINVLTGALLGSPSDHIPGSPVATVVGYSGSYFNWLFTASGPMELRVRTTTYYTAGTIIYSIGTGGFYIEDMGAI